MFVKCVCVCGLKMVLGWEKEIYPSTKLGGEGVKVLIVVNSTTEVSSVSNFSCLNTISSNPPPPLPLPLHFHGHHHLWSFRKRVVVLSAHGGTVSSHSFYNLLKSCRKKMDNVR